MSIKANCLAIFESLLTIADRRSNTPRLGVTGNVKSSKCYFDVRVYHSYHLHDAVLRDYLLKLEDLVQHS